MAELYRAIAGAASGEIMQPHETCRVPKNVPYVVDNLWAWARPEGYADRRHCAYASLTVEQARSAGDGPVYRVELRGGHTVCQLRGYSDASCHPDTRELKGELIERLGGTDWANRPAGQKAVAAALFLPVAKAAEVDQALDACGWSEADKAGLRNAVRFWDDVAVVGDDEAMPCGIGEVFFTYPDGYILRALD